MGSSGKRKGGAARLAGSPMPEEKNKFGETPLVTAAKEGKIGEVKKLVGAGADLSAADKWGRTALMWASREGFTETLEFLIESKADLELKDKYGKTAFNWASEKGNDSCAKALLDAGCGFLQPGKMIGGGDCMSLAMDTIAPKLCLEKIFPAQKKK